MAEIDFAKIEKACDTCGETFINALGFYKKPGNHDGFDGVCRSCRMANRKVKQQSTDEIIVSIDSGEFEVDQKWLLKEIIGQYKDPKCRDRLKALEMLMKVSGYNSSSTDDKAVVDSLMESLKNGRDKE